MSQARRAEVELFYERIDITKNIAPYGKSFSFTDVASGESDRIELSMQDSDGKWMGGWAPEKGDHISANAGFMDWRKEGDHWKIYCGSFEVDDVTLSGPPAVCKIGAVSIPRSEAFHEEQRTKNWENVTVCEVAEEIASRYGIAVFYDTEEIPIKALEQDKQTDCQFLYSVCKKYGLAMKVFEGKIVIFSEADYEAAPPVATLHREEFSNYTYNSTLEGTYTGAKIAYMDPGTGENHIVTVGGGSRILEINEEADSSADAQRKAVAALNNANKKAVTLSGSVMSRPELVSSSCVQIEGFGKPDGIYYIDQVITRIGNKGASRQSLTMHKVGYRMDNAEVLLDVLPESREQGSGISYTVVKGDTLWTIAQVHLGSALRYSEVYELNKETIEAEAKSRGKRDSSNGHWIFPGTVLQLPGI